MTDVPATARRRQPRHARRRPTLHRLLLPFLRARPRALALLLAWSVVEAAPALISGQAVAHALDHGFLAGRPLAGFAALAVMAASAVVGAWGTSRVYPLLAQVVEPLRDDLVRLVVAGALERSVRRDEVPDTAGVARLTHQVEIVRDSFAGMLMVSRGFLFTVGSAVVGMLSLDPAVMALTLPPLALGVALFFAVLARLSRRQRELILADEDVAETMSTALAGLRDVVASGAGARVAGWVGPRVNAQARAALRIAGLGAARDAAIGVGGWLPVLLVVAAAPSLARHGASAGAILGTLTYLTQAMMPALQTLTRGVGGAGVQLAVTLARITQAAGVDWPSDANQAAATMPAAPSPDGALAPVRAPRAGGAVTLCQVSFGYGAHAAPVLRDLDLAIPAGDHLAVVGPSGVGKSTLASLIAGTLRPQAGVVLLGGVPLPELSPGALASYRTLIPQQAYVFTGTLGENLCYLAPNRDRAALTRASAALGLGPLVDRLGGFGGMVAPAMLSAGERQLVALARAYLSDAPLIVLDEATCHLDPAAEARVEEAFARRAGALVVIAHRVSSALRARRVLVLDGAAATLGTHERLLAVSSLYRDLVGHWGESEADGQSEAPDRAVVTPAKSELAPWGAAGRGHAGQ